LNNVAAPERSVAITQPTPGKMLSRHARHTEFIRNRRNFPPIQFDNVINTASGEKREVAEADYKAWVMIGV